MKEMPTTPKMSYLKRGFTLLELLVVIVVMMILIAMLLPALGRARGLGKRITCVGNMKQMFLGGQQYADTYRHYTPWYTRFDDGRGTVGHWYSMIGREFGWFPGGNAKSAAHSIYRPSLNAKPKSPSIFFCPDGVWGGNKDDYFYQATSYFTTVYVINMERPPVEGSRGVSITQVKTPSNKIYIYDTGNQASYVPGSGKTPGCTSDPNYSPIAAQRNDFYNGRHMRSNNALFFDGHVNTMTSDDMYYEKSKHSTRSDGMFNVMK